MRELEDKLLKEEIWLLCLTRFVIVWFVSSYVVYFIYC